MLNWNKIDERPASKLNFCLKQRLTAPWINDICQRNACKRSCLIAKISLCIPRVGSRTTRRRYGMSGKLGERAQLQSRGKLCRGESARSFVSNCLDPFPAAEQVRPGSLARYTAAASIIPNYNNKCKSGITTRKPGNKVSPGARSCHSCTSAIGIPALLPFPRSGNGRIDESTITIITNKLNQGRASARVFLHFFQRIPRRARKERDLRSRR